jgi:hypothetical protein
MKSECTFCKFPVSPETDNVVTEYDVDGEAVVLVQVADKDAVLVVVHPVDVVLVADADKQQIVVSR